MYTIYEFSPPVLKFIYMIFQGDHRLGERRSVGPRRNYLCVWQGMHWKRVRSTRPGLRPNCVSIEQRRAAVLRSRGWFYSNPAHSSDLIRVASTLQDCTTTQKCLCYDGWMGAACDIRSNTSRRILFPKMVMPSSSNDPHHHVFPTLKGNEDLVFRFLIIAKKLNLLIENFQFKNRSLVKQKRFWADFFKHNNLWNERLNFVNFFYKFLYVVEIFNLIFCVKFTYFRSITWHDNAAGNFVRRWHFSAFVAHLSSVLLSVRLRLRL